MKLQIGDRVQYSRGFLRSIGEITGPMPFAKGTVTGFKPLGKETMLAEIDWRRDDIPGLVNVKNLHKIGTPEPV